MSTIINNAFTVGLFAAATFILASCSVVPTVSGTQAKPLPNYATPLADFRRADLNIVTTEFIDQYSGQYVVFEGAFFMTQQNARVTALNRRPVAMVGLRGMVVGDPGSPGRLVTVIWCEDDRDLALPLISLRAGQQVRVYAYILPAGKRLECKHSRGSYAGLGAVYPVLINVEAASGAEAAPAQPASQAPVQPATRPASVPVRTMSVVEAQRKLLALGYDVGGADGKLGPKTAAALRDFQSKNGLPVTGALDSATSAALAD